MASPVVTIRGSFARSRITSALLTPEFEGELVVESPEAYIAQANRIACDNHYKSRIREKLRRYGESRFECSVFKEIMQALEQVISNQL